MAIAVTEGGIFKHYYVQIFLPSKNGLANTVDIECKNRESQMRLFYYLNRSGVEDLYYGDILDLKFANEIINDQRRDLKEYKRQLDELDGLLNKYQLTFEELEEILDKR